MKIDILTLFPEMFKGPFDYSIVSRAKEKGLAEINIHNLRKWTSDKRKTVDDKPYGGGVGMVMMVEPIDHALRDLTKCEVGIEKLETEVGNENYESHVTSRNPASHISHPISTKIVLLSPRGKVFSQKMAQEYSKLDHLILICGHYEGVDERVSEYLIDEEISIGDYVLTGGEIPAMAITDSVIRLIPGVLEKTDATRNESFSSSPCSNDLNHDNKEQLLEYPQSVNPLIRNLLEYPQYTRPENYKGWKVPEILLSGDPKKIKAWQEEKAKEKTSKVRPDLCR